MGEILDDLSIGAPATVTGDVPLPEALIPPGWPISGGIGIPHDPRDWWSVDLLFGSRFYSWEQCSMNESKSKKNTPLHDGFEWAGAVARVRRGARSNRAGRRTALLSMLTAAYVNSSRGGRTSERTTGER